VQSQYFGVFETTRYFFQKKYVALDLPTSVDLATNKLIATTLSGIAEFENNRRKERQKQGIRAAQKEGKYQGRKTVINKALIQKVKDLKENSNLSMTEISRVIGISRPTIYKILKEHLGYVSSRLVKPEAYTPCE
jgi:DNA invertase Pin-like site-specific DNA recombinase